MKTTVSVPDRVFKDAEKLARRSRKSRSQLYSDALREYVARHGAEEVTEAMNRVCDDLGDGPPDRFLRAAGQRTLERSEW